MSVDNLSVTGFEDEALYDDDSSLAADSGSRNYLIFHIIKILCLRC